MPAISGPGTRSRAVAAAPARRRARSSRRRRSRSATSRSQPRGVSASAAKSFIGIRCATTRATAPASTRPDRERCRLAGQPSLDEHRVTGRQHERRMTRHDAIVRAGRRIGEDEVARRGPGAIAANDGDRAARVAAPEHRVEVAHRPGDQRAVDRVVAAERPGLEGRAQLRLAAAARQPHAGAFEQDDRPVDARESARTGRRSRRRRCSRARRTRRASRPADTSRFRSSGRRRSSSGIER